MRPRKSNRHLPPCVYQKHGAYYLVKRGKWERLGADLPSALAEYGRRMSAAAPSGAMAKLIDDALASLRVSPNTLAQYRGAAARLKEMLAEFEPHQVRPVHIAQIKQGLADTPNMANRILSFARTVFNFALESQLVESNPVVGVRRLAEAKRTRLITRAEFDRIREQAPDRLKAMMDLLYLTGQRVNDVVWLRRSALREEGIYFEQQKTGTRLVVQWTPALREAVRFALSLHGERPSVYLFTSRGGKPPGPTTVNHQWLKACTDAGVEDAEMRDIRAMAGTSAQQQGLNPTALLGHASPTMTARYLRAKTVPVVEGPEFPQSIGHQIDSAANS